MDFKSVENKWQKKWEKARVFEVGEKAPYPPTRKMRVKKKFYVLEMYPYPSGSGLHMGHAFNYTIGDVYSRFKRMQGFNVLYPMGYDSFGLPAENAAIKAGEHPRKYTEKAIKSFIKQQKKLGLSYDWSRMLMSHDLEYYKWNQYFFLKFFEKGLVYRKKAPVNWCPKCKTVLANEQVHGGKCWRHEDTDVETKHLEQWFIKTSKYAEELLKDIEKLQWPERIKVMQKNWIGKSSGSEILFEIEGKIDNCVILHGSPSKDRTKEKNYTPNNLQHWIPWLKKELENRGVKVTAPQMPTPWVPKYKEWKKIMDGFDVNENSVLIGHSSGGAFLVRWLGETGKKIRKLILVSPGKAGREIEAVLKDFYGSGTDVKIKKNLGGISIFTADDDIDYHITNAHEYKKELDGKLIHFGKGYGHFCEKEMGTKEFPELLNEIVDRWPVFTTRPDTICGVTFMVISAQHPKLMEIVTKEQRKKVEVFLKKIKTLDENELEKEGVFTGSYAINPVNAEKIPIWVGNFVIADYGSGMVMAVPAHDQRDFEFAKKYKIPIRQVIKGGNIKEEAYTGEGGLINSGNFSGLISRGAKEHIVKYLKGKGLGKKTVQFKLRDWLVSRQRYWGTPIPVVYCDKCGIVPVPEKDLPIKLPEKVNFGKGNPLETAKNWVNVKCPKCKGKAKRETDTMDTFFDSSWYFLRYCDNKNNKLPFDKKKVDYWMPVDQYIGGAEHACMHLIYARFFTKALRDLGFLKFDEPFTKLFNQGMLHGSDGFVMSKSRGNVILPEEISKKYGIDTARFFLISIASPDKDLEWNDKGVKGINKFLKKVFDYAAKIKIGNSSKKIQHKVNKGIKEITKDVGNFHYNLAAIKIRELFDSFEEKISKKDWESFIKLLSPFCPHIAEELWSKLGNKSFISLESWPVVDEKKIDDDFDEQGKAVEQIVEDINHIKGLVKNEVSKGFIYALPQEKEVYSEEINLINKKTNLNIEVFAVNDKGKYDPENKSKKAKPGKPAIYLE